MASEIAPRRLQGWKKRELREHRSGAGVPNLRTREEGDGEDRFPGRRFVPRGPGVVKLGKGFGQDAVPAPRPGFFVPCGANFATDLNPPEERFGGSVFCFAGWSAEELQRVGKTIRRAATLRPGDFFLPRELPARFKFMDGADAGKWAAFFTAAGWPADVSAVLAGEESSKRQAPSTKEAPVNSKGGRQ